jgi:integrase
MSVRFHRGGWEVRWRDSAGKQRARRFPEEAPARAFDDALAEVSPVMRRTDTIKHGRSDGIYPYETTGGARWRFVYRRSDGTQTTKRGFSSQRAARDARRHLVEQVERGEVRHTKETFGGYWARWLTRRRRYLEAGTWSGYEIHGRKRLVPAFGSVSLGEVSVDEVPQLRSRTGGGGRSRRARDQDGEQRARHAGDLPQRRRQGRPDRRQPALLVGRLPLAHIERDYLRLDEIRRYLDGCSDLYRPLAERLIGSGLRISEALALRPADLELEPTGGRIIVYRSRKRDGLGSTKSDRFRSVEIGPGLSGVLRDLAAIRAEIETEFLFVMPVRDRRFAQGSWESTGPERPFDRTTVSRDWHKHALQDAALRDMRLHALRHTAAASWLAAGNSLMYVQRQLGHADIGTTERYYGHLERHVLAAGAVATEEAIARAAGRRR